eukprot:TRINITY_DN90010_c0_g1_i1.p1 TRINITY_DN90010_c0_g1~~TRINITY_DN90010_c0_g1_i1.p1  ORF type:complete len:889 (+),score=105.08 TRINITY_DN90010_c0_g1_i1:288-2669(+)
MSEEDGPISGREAARLCCAIAFLCGVHVLEFKSLLDATCATIERIQQRALFQKPFEGAMALADHDHVAQRLLELPVLILNLDRSPHRLEDMRQEVRRCGIRARRFAATDGRHRVTRRSTTEPYMLDLTEFALRWDEARPARGLAMTAHCERHFVGYVGSWLSHMRAVRHGLEEGFPFVAVIEDDQRLSTDFNSVVRDVIECAGDVLDVVILGPLDWRLRSLRYAQGRKIMQLRSRCSNASRSAEEVFIAQLYGYAPELEDQAEYFLYSIGSKAMGGDDLMSTGCCGVWGYLVSRSGCQKMQSSMKFMWESFDDVLQAELQGDNRFTCDVGKLRLWGVWPPIVTSDGKWPSQNPGEDLDMGRQHVPVSPHAGFRDPSLQTEIARMILGPDHLFVDAGTSFGNGDSPCELLLTLAAASALLWSPVEPIWAYVVVGWRRLFDQRHGSGHGFELRTEMQLHLLTSRRFFEICTEGLTWSWTLLRAAYLFKLVEPMAVQMGANPPEGPPVQLLPLSVRIIEGCSAQLLFCPDAWFRDLAEVVKDVDIVIHKDSASHTPAPRRDLLSKLRTQLPRASVQPVSVSVVDQRSQPASTPFARNVVVLAAGIHVVHRGLIAALIAELKSGGRIVVTSSKLAPLLEVLDELDGHSHSSERPEIIFFGVNPFGSCLPAQHSNDPAGGASAPKPGALATLCDLISHPALNGREAFVIERVAASGRWRVRIAGGKEMAVQEANLRVHSLEPWPPAPPSAAEELTADEVWRAVQADRRAEAYEQKIQRLIAARPPSTNAFWLGLQSSV